MVSLRIRQPTIYFGFLFLSVEGKKSPFKKLGHNFAQNRRKIKEIKKSWGIFGSARILDGWFNYRPKGTLERDNIGACKRVEYKVVSQKLFPLPYKVERVHFTLWRTSLAAATASIPYTLSSSQVFQVTELQFLDWQSFGLWQQQLLRCRIILNIKGAAKSRGRYYLPMGFWYWSCTTMYQTFHWYVSCFLGK